MGNCRNHGIRLFHGGQIDQLHAVLLFGLMGVAAIFPVGNHYAGRGEQFDRGSALAEAAFESAWERGRALSTDEAIALALEETEFDA